MGLHAPEQRTPERTPEPSAASSPKERVWENDEAPDVSPHEVVSTPNSPKRSGRPVASVQTTRPEPAAGHTSTTSVNVQPSPSARSISTLKSPQRPAGPGRPTTAASEAATAQWQPPQPKPPAAGGGLLGFLRRPSSIFSGRGPPAPARETQRTSLAGSFLEQASAAGGVAPPREVRGAANNVGAAISAAKRYSAAMNAMAGAAAEFGAALDKCSTIRSENPEDGAGLQAAAGLHLLISNHFHVLSSSVDSKFVDPASRQLAHLESELLARECELRQQLTRRNADLRKAEADIRRKARGRQRDLIDYRNSLIDLTAQIDDMNSLKYDFLHELHHLSSSICGELKRDVASVVSAEVELFESMARKGWSGGGLDGLLGGCPDPFVEGSSSSDEASHENSNDELPSVLSVLKRDHLLPRAPSSEDVADLTISTEEHVAF